MENHSKIGPSSRKNLKVGPCVGAMRTQGYLYTTGMGTWRLRACTCSSICLLQVVHPRYPPMCSLSLIPKHPIWCSRRSRPESSPML